ncbi:MAG: spermidine synthase, partial [Planctomycetes bacterium]|nr:spermidine synthase [Planctomycetota bacterium]
MHFALLIVFSATIFVSAMLLFMVQPLVGKILLPYLGGTPAVWNTCMVFFQALLLGGYFYAHRLKKIPSLRVQLIIQGAILL